MSTALDQLTVAIAARKDSLKALRGRITKLLEPIPVGVVLSDDEGEVCRVVRICTGASQWGNRTWDITITGLGYLTPSGRLLAAEIDESEFDSQQNLCYRKSEPLCLFDRNGDPGRSLQFEAGAETRKLAVRLARAVELYVEHCRQEATANEGTRV